MSRYSFVILKRIVASGARTCYCYQAAYFWLIFFGYPYYIEQSAAYPKRIAGLDPRMIEQA